MKKVLSDYITGNKLHIDDVIKLPDSIDVGLQLAAVSIIKMYSEYSTLGREILSGALGVDLTTQEYAIYIYNNVPAEEFVCIAIRAKMEMLHIPLSKVDDKTGKDMVRWLMDIGDMAKMDALAGSML